MVSGSSFASGPRGIRTLNPKIANSKLNNVRELKNVQRIRYWTRTNFLTLIKLEIGLEPLIARFSYLWKYINTQNFQFLP
jgi:hypothetical protein